MYCCSSLLCTQKSREDVDPNGYFSAGLQECWGDLQNGSRVHSKSGVEIVNFLIYAYFEARDILRLETKLDFILQLGHYRIDLWL